MKKLIFLFTILSFITLWGNNLKIDNLNWRNQGAKIEKNSNGNLTIVFNKTLGKYLQARKGINKNLKDFNCLSFKLKASSNISNLYIIFWSQNQRAIANSAIFAGDNVLPKEEWIECFWLFRKNNGWITPKKEKPFNFDKVNAIAFNCEAQKLLANEVSLEIKDICFTKVDNNKVFQKNIYNTNWKAEGAKYTTTKDTLIVTYNKTFGKYPQVRKFFSNGLKNYNQFSCEIKLSCPMPGLAFILQQGKYRAIASAIDIAQVREFPTNKWIKVNWSFRKTPGWITPPRSSAFNFDDATSIAFNCTTSSLPSGNQTMEVKNMRFEYVDESISQLALAKKAFAKTVFPSTLKGKKIIVWPNHGVKNSNTLEVFVKDISLYHNLPIDGVNLDMAPAPFRDSFFSPNEIDYSAFEKAKKIVKNTQWKNLKNNFFRIDIASSWGKTPDNKRRHFDWFDNKAWEIILKKITKFAQICKECNFNIMFDTEAYTTEPYDYYKHYKKTNKSFQEYQKQVFLRGKQVASAFAKGHPNGTILMMFSSWVVKIAPELDRYGLLPAFIDGMCAAKTNLTIIDGYEGGYEFTNEQSIKNGLYSIKVLGPKNSSNPSLYKEVIKSSFGLWLRPQVFTPQQFSSLIDNSLKYSDAYVWIYLEKNPITNKEVKACFDAIKRK